MSFAAGNAFVVLDDETEDIQAVANKAAAAAKQQAAAKDAADKDAAKAAAAAAPARPQSARPGRGDGRGRGLGGFDRPRSGEGEVAENGFESGTMRRREDGEARRCRGRGRGRGRGRAGEGGEGRRPRREFDRHSATGRGHEVSKRGGAGKGNWGSEADAPTNPEEVPKAEGESVEAPVDTPEVEVGADAEPVEEETKELSLEEYEKQILEKKMAMGWVADEYSKREVDMTQFNGMKVTSKKAPEDEFSGLELSDAKKKEKAAKNANALKTKVVADVGFRVADENAGNDRREERGGRGGRGGRDRGDGARHSGPRRGEGRGGGRTGPAPNIMDESAFPSLR